MISWSRLGPSCLHFFGGGESLSRQSLMIIDPDVVSQENHLPASEVPQTTSKLIYYCSKPCLALQSAILRHQNSNELHTKRNVQRGSYSTTCPIAFLDIKCNCLGRFQPSLVQRERLLQTFLNINLQKTVKFDHSDDLYPYPSSIPGPSVGYISIRPRNNIQDVHSSRFTLRDYQPYVKAVFSFKIVY